jgi:O-antigen/teichoic acid export membrane protein
LHGTRIAQFLAIGVTVNCLAYVPATIIQARGRADLMAKMHLAQVPVFLALLATLVRLHGAEGAAIATALRCVMDAAMVFMVCGRMVPGAQPRLRPGQIATVVLALAALGGGMMDMDLWWKLWYFLAVMATFAGLAWYVLLDPSERNRARDPLALLMART